MTKMAKLSMVCAGIDIGKFKLDAAIEGRNESLEVGNSPDGYIALAAWLRRHRVKRVGMEASGGYELPVMAALRRAGFVVVCLQPIQVRAYATFKLQRAKNDRIDAALIATCTAAVAEVRPPPDPRFAVLASRLTMIEQLTEDVARLKTRCEACRDPHGLEFWRDEIARLKACIRTELKQLVADIRKHSDLAARLELLTSVDGVGLRTAVAVLIRMPEIGNVSREQAAALAGLAPYDDDSGSRTGQRHIAFGRERLRTSLYAASLPAAFKWNQQLMAHYRRLTGQGKPHKVALVACARKLIIFLNTVVARGTPWIAKPAAI
ncbi:IS110 family transposase [Rhodopseudomonas palustris]|uniref:IS110 family transposase n=1 Tax=Rhodopseudomonas palustris TaxID=1076 RepID=UPI001F2F8086|nr:IS110 family transposase [Rhodopseudomonas palustris]